MQSNSFPEPNQLYQVYQNVFAPSEGEPDTERFQRLASDCLATGVRVGTPEYEAFKAYLVEKSNDPEWRPTAEQIEALSYILGTDANASLVRPWTGEPTW